MSHYFHAILYTLAAFAKKKISEPSSFDETCSKILKNMKYLWFKDRVGAIDGTHIPAVVPIEKSFCISLSEEVSAHRMTRLYVLST